MIPAIPPPILLAEDEENDVFMFRRAMRKADLSVPLVVVHDGQEAIEYLSGDPPFSDRTSHPLPGLLVLDLKMPRLTGFEVLAWLCEKPDLGGIPAVVLSSSCYDQDIHKALKLGAKEYHIKPGAPDDLVRLVQRIAERWLVAQI